MKLDINLTKKSSNVVYNKKRNIIHVHWSGGRPQNSRKPLYSNGELLFLPAKWNNFLSMVVDRRKIIPFEKWE